MTATPEPPSQVLAALDAARTKRALADRTADLRTSELANEALRRANAELATSRAALAASEARLRVALGAARMANWEWAAEDGQVSGSEGREALYGRPHGSLGTIPAVLDAVLPVDRALAAATIQRGMMRQPLEPFAEDTFDAVEFRVADPDGTVRWLCSQGRVTERDPRTGQALRAAGVTFDISKRKEAEERYLVLFDTAPFTVIVIDPETHRILDVNGRACAQYGYTRDEFLRLGITDIDVLGKSGAIRARGRAAVVGSGAQEFEARHRDKAGEIRDVLVRAQGIRLGGREVTYCAHFDITARKAAEASLRDSENRLATALRAARFGVWSRDLRSGVVQWDARTRAIFGGLSDAEGSGLSEFVRCVHPEDRACREALIEAAIAAGGPDTYTVEFRFRQPDGHIGWIATYGAVIERDPDTGIGQRLVGVVQDISDRKAAEDAISDATEHLRVALDAGGLGTWELDFAADRAGFDARLAAILGWPDEPVEVAVMAFERRIHPEDRDRTMAEFRTAATGRTAFVSEFRILRPDGSIRWLQGRGRPVQGGREPKGEPGEHQAPQRLSGVALDVTERRRAEERQALLVREVDHRAKNALAVVQAVLRLSPRHDPAAFANAVEGRVAALARAHTLLAEGGWEGAELRTLLEAELAPFLPHAAAPHDGPRARILLSGPRVTVAPHVTQPLSMALHELATNAVKYGGLSTMDGRVLLSWRLDTAAGLLRLRWDERGGPEVAAAPTRSGFGSRLISTTLSQQLGGRVRHEWRPAGLLVEVDLPSATVVV